MPKTTASKGGVYAVVGGPTPGVYATWDDAVAHGAQGQPGAKCKGFKTREEAEAFIANPPPWARGSASSSGSRKAAAKGRKGERKGGKSAAAREARVALRLYTDGACPKNQNMALGVPAGWGVAVVDGDQCRQELFCPVELNKKSAFFLGATICSNNTAELSAVCEALLWLGENEPGREAAICYDSDYAANIAQGLFKAHKNPELAARASALHDAVGAQRPLQFIHVKGHSGHRWNDLADELANRRARGEVCHAGRFSEKAEGRKRPKSSPPPKSQSSKNASSSSLPPRKRVQVDGRLSRGTRDRCPSLRERSWRSRMRRGPGGTCCPSRPSHRTHTHSILYNTCVCTWSCARMRHVCKV